MAILAGLLFGVIAVAVWFYGSHGGAVLWGVLALLMFVVGYHLRTRGGMRVLTPEQATRFVVENYDKLTEQDIGKAEGEMMRAAPRSEERCLLYALRVSKAVDVITKLNTLVSRWNGVNSARGLSGAMDSPNYKLVHDFLVARYLAKFKIISNEIVQKAETKSVGREKNLRQAMHKLMQISMDFTTRLPGAEEHLASLDKRLEAAVGPRTLNRIDDRAESKHD